MLKDPAQQKLLDAMKRTRKRSKYNNTRVRLDGITFDSIAEAARYVVLVSRRDKGDIACLHVHPKYFFKCGGTYRPDFSYCPAHYSSLRERYYNSHVVEDVKSKPTRTAIYRRNKSMMKDEFGIEVQEITMDPVVAKTLVAAYAGKRR